MKLALFDLDKTLLPIDSDQAWGEFATRLGWTDGDVFLRRNNDFYEQYKAGVLHVPDYVRFATEAFVQQGRDKSLAAHAQFMREVIEPVIRPEALQLVRQHQNAGDLVAIVTATNEFVTRPIAQAFGVQHLLAIELVRDAQGWFTGEILGVPSAQAGKVTRVHQWLQSQGLQWQNVTHSVFYTDSMNDIALLELVHEPVVTNPDPRLRQLAQTRGWRILDLFEGVY